MITLTVKYYITLLFQLFEEFEASDTIRAQPSVEVHPQVYPDSSLIVFFGHDDSESTFNRFKAQHRWLLTHPDWLATLQL